MSEHTPEPWFIGAEPMVVRGRVCAKMADGETAVVADTNSYFPESGAADARRIVSCVNFCAGVTSEELDEGVQIFGGLEAIVLHIYEQKKLRDQLLAAARKAIAECCDLIATPAGDALSEAIAKCEVQP